MIFIALGLVSYSTTAAFKQNINIYLWERWSANRSENCTIERVGL